MRVADRRRPFPLFMRGVQGGNHSPLVGALPLLFSSCRSPSPRGKWLCLSLRFVAPNCKKRCSMICPDYVRNFMADFIFGKPVNV